MSNQKEGEELKSKAIKGILWGGLSTAIQQFLTFGFGIYLGRNLTAEDYGLIGILTIFTLIAGSVQESGFISALANRKKVDFRDYNAVFWTSVLTSLCLYTVLFFLAPVISLFFDIPVLTRLARLLFLGFVASSFGIAHHAYLFKNLKVKERSLATTLSVLIAGVSAVTLVYLNFSYWALAIQPVVYGVSFSTICFLQSSFRPSLPVDFSPILSMWRFSSKILLTNVFMHINNNILTVFLGKISTANTVGYYTQANKWSNMAQGVVANMSHGFAQPMLADLNSDNERQNRVFLKLLHFICFVSFPALALLCIVAREFIVITITDKWMPSVRILQVLCINAAFLPLINFYSNYFLSRGMSNVYMRNIITFGLLQLIIIFSLSSFEIIYIVWGMSLFTVAWSFVWQYSVARYSNISYLLLSHVIFRYVFMVAVAGLISYHIGETFASLYLSILVKGLCFISLYVLQLYLLKSEILFEIISFVKQKYAKR